MRLNRRQFIQATAVALSMAAVVPTWAPDPESVRRSWRKVRLKFKGPVGHRSAHGDRTFGRTVDMGLLLEE